MLKSMSNAAFTGTVIFQTPFTFYDFLEYAIFAVMLVAGIMLFRKGRKKIVRLAGAVMAVIGGGCLCWLAGWQIYIKMFLL